MNLFKVIEPYLAKPFQWGVNDCLIFSGSIAQEISGITIIEDIRGKYATPKGALKLLNCYGLETLDEIFGLFFEEMLPSYAKRGDVVLMSHKGLWGEVLGVCIGTTAYTTSEKGLIKVPMRYWIKAWRVK